jgi:hypothetical protein
VHLGRILHGCKLGDGADVDIQFQQGGARVLEKALLEGGIDPGARDDLGPQCGRTAVHQVDGPGDLLGAKDALLDQERAQGLFQDLVGAHGSRIMILLQRRVCMAAMRGALSPVVVIILVHVPSYLAGSSQCS